MIQLTKTYHPDHHLAVLIGKNDVSLEDVPAVVNEQIQLFSSSENDFDFLKIGAQFFFLIKENVLLEKMRVAGSKVRTQLPKEAEYLDVIGNGEAALALSEGFILSNYQFLTYFTDKEKRKNAFKKVHLVAEIEETKVDRLNNILKATMWARDMVNEPVSFLTAAQLSQEILKLGEEAGFEVNILEKAKIEALKMGGLLAVNKGSVEPPTFTILEYKPSNPRNTKPIVLVGKGVVYDTGGLSLKPTPGSMDAMKSDMAGAACMAGAVYAAALNKVDLHIIGLIPATDNRPGGNAYTPGDVITMYDGTTIEVLNTDAEGRMILADAIAYANKYEPEVIIDAATLTGAAMIAIGTKASCLMGNAEQEQMNKLIDAGNEVHERLVLLPFWDDYLEDMKSSVADMKNIGSRYAGMITAGKFLEHFAKYPYIHMDIAGPSFLDAAQDYKGKGGTGTGVRLLSNYFDKY